MKINVAKMDLRVHLTEHMKIKKTILTELDGLAYVATAAILNYTASRDITCPTCGTISDEEDVVLVDVTLADNDMPVRNIHMCCHCPTKKVNHLVPTFEGIEEKHNTKFLMNFTTAIHHNLDNIIL